MRTLLILLLAFATAYAKEYYAKAEPYELLNVSSNVAAEVLYTDVANEGKILGRKPYLIMDDKLDQIELKSTETKISALQNSIEHNLEMAQNYSEIIRRKEENYERIKDLKVKSLVEKDREYYDLVNSRNSLLSIQKENESLRIQLGDLSLRRSQLKKSIRDKHLSAPGYVLYKLSVKSSAFVNPGTLLAQIADVRKGKLTLFLNAKEADDARKKIIYLNGKRTSYKIDRIWKIADGTRLSDYKAEIVITPPNRFSQLMKVEFKDE